MRGPIAARAQLPPFPARSQSQPSKPQPPPCPQYETIVHHPLQMKHFVPPKKVLNHLQRPVLESIPPPLSLLVETVFISLPAAQSSSHLYTSLEQLGPLSGG